MLKKIIYFLNKFKKEIINLPKWLVVQCVLHPEEFKLYESMDVSASLTMLSLTVSSFPIKG